MIADNLSKAGWTWGCVSGVDSRGRTIWIADAHRDDGKRFVARVDEKLTASLELKSAIRAGERLAKSIKASVLDAKMSLTSAPNESDQSKRDRYEKEQEEIKSEAEHKQAAAKSNFHKHEVFARGVTMFQITIAIAESPLLQGNATSGLSVCSSDLSAAPFSSSPRSRIRGDLPHSPCA